MAAEKVYESLLKERTQKNVLDIMQTREELYERLNGLLIKPCSHQVQLDLVVYCIKVSRLLLQM